MRCRRELVSLRRAPRHTYTGADHCRTVGLADDAADKADVLALEMCNFAVVSRADYLAVVNEKHKTEVSDRHLADGHVPNMRQLAPAHIPNMAGGGAQRVLHCR